MGLGHFSAGVRAALLGLAAAGALTFVAAATSSPAAAPPVTFTINYPKTQLHYSGRAVSTNSTYVKAPKDGEPGQFTFRTTITPAKFKRSSAASGRRATTAVLVLTLSTKTLTYTFVRPWISKIQTVGTTPTNTTVKLTIAFDDIEVQQS